jgi:hypothetical protein
MPLSGTSFVGLKQLFAVVTSATQVLLSSKKRSGRLADDVNGRSWFPTPEVR